MDSTSTRIFKFDNKSTNGARCPSGEQHTNAITYQSISDKTIPEIHSKE